MAKQNKALTQAVSAVGELDSGAKRVIIQDKAVATEISKAINDGIIDWVNLQKISLAGETPYYVITKVAQNETDATVYYVDFKDKKLLKVG
jgi:hypothetical protein